MVKRRQSSAGVSTGDDSARGSSSLDKKGFLMALIRLALLVKSAKDGEESSSPTKDLSLLQQEATAIASALEFTRQFIQRRVMPLSILSVAELESLQDLQQPAVQLCLSKPDNNEFLKVRRRHVPVCMALATLRPAL